MSRLRRAGGACVWLGLIAATVLALHPIQANASDGLAPPWGMRAPSKSVTLPAFELPDSGGEIVRASDLQGKVVVVRFWATW